jgi:hypothetical protein
MAAAILSGGCSGGSTPAVVVSEGADSEQALVSKFEEAHQSRGTAKIMALGYWEGVPEGDRSLFEMDLGKVMSRSLRSVKIEPVNEHLRLKIAARATDFQLPPVVGRLEVRYAESWGDGVMYIPVVVKSGKYYLTHLSGD